MRKQRKKHGSRNMAARVPFGQINYYYETGNFATQRKYAMAVYGSDARHVAPVALNGRVKFVKRMFRTYEEAVVHLTNVKLGLQKEDYPFSYYTPYKLLAGYRQGGQKRVTMTKVIATLPFKRARSTDNGDYYVRPGLGSEESRRRLIRQQWPDSLPVS